MGKRGFISANNALFLSVDLIGEKNQVILECDTNFPANIWQLHKNFKMRLRFEINDKKLSLAFYTNHLYLICTRW